LEFLDIETKPEAKTHRFQEKWAEYTKMKIGLEYKLVESNGQMDAAEEEDDDGKLTLNVFYLSIPRADNT
jgi:hypothetical protein